MVLSVDIKNVNNIDDDDEDEKNVHKKKRTTMMNSSCLLRASENQRLKKLSFQSILFVTRRSAAEAETTELSWLARGRHWETSRLSPKTLNEQMPVAEQF